MAYDLSAAENIGVGNLPAAHDRDRLIRAARQAGVHPVIESTAVRLRHPAHPDLLR